MLADLVAAGKLPPLAERLPQDPLVVTPYEKPGLYGGTWRTTDISDDLNVWRIVGGYAPLLRWNADASAIVPGTASAWEMSADGTTLTFHLRRGLKWSDGDEWNAEDLLYWWSLVTDGRTHLTAPFWSLVDGKPMTVTAPDDYTVVFTFAGANRYAPLHVATTIDWQDQYNTPAHYLKQYDPRHNPKYTDFAEWDRRSGKGKSFTNPDRPTLCAWKVASIEDSRTRVRLVRNPYYWMTDSEGRQLPYIDKVVVTIIPDGQVRALSYLSGEVDAQFRLVDIDNYALFMKGRKRGGYRIVRWTGGSGARNALVPNWDEKDPVLRELIRDKRFRRALSHGVDREKCNQIAWRGFGTPQQATISRQSWHFRTPEGKALFEEWAGSFDDFDLEKGNALLDEIGLTKRDSEGYRLRPDGERLSILFDVPASQQGGPYLDEVEIAKDGWTKLGIETVIKPWTLTVYGFREGAGDFTFLTSDMAEMDLFAFPDWVFPTRPQNWHPQVGRWYSKGGKEGEAPEGPTRELLDIYARILAEPDLEKAHALVREAVRIHIDEGPIVIGTVADVPALILVKENMKNVPDEPRVLGAWAIGAPATSFPETFFYEAAPRSTPARASRADSEGQEPAK